MSVAILSAAAPLPEPYVNPWPGLSVIWEGWDGSEWDLTDGKSGVALYLAGVEGLHFPRFTRYTSKSRAIPGNRSRGWRAEEREVFWPILLWADGSDAWAARNNAFMRSMHPGRPGVWRVRAGSAPERRLALTLDVRDGYAFQIDPLRRGWAEYPITLEAAQPYWVGERIVAGPWSAPNPVDFFGEGGPPFYISEQATFGSASITNPGDIEAWGTWTAVGPLSELKLGVADTVVEVPFSIPDGKTLVIDTDPRRPTATLGDTVPDPDGFVGEDATAQLGLQDYAPVPDGGDVALHVEATGAGSVQFQIDPLYFRAF